MLTCFIFTGALFLSDGQGLMLRHDQVGMTQKRGDQIIVDAGYSQHALLDLSSNWLEKIHPRDPPHLS